MPPPPPPPPTPAEDHACLIFTSYGPLAIFISKSCLYNYPCSFQWILVKSFSYRANDQMRIIVYPSHA